MKGWHQIPENGSVLGIRIVFWVVQTLGYLPAVCVLIFPVTANFLFNKSARKHSRDYLRKVGVLGSQSSWLQDKIKVYKHLFAFALNVLDRVFIWSGRMDLFKISLEGHEWMMALNEKKQGALLVGAHLGSFDFLRVLSEQYAVRVNVVMYGGASQKITQSFVNLNPHYEMNVFDASKGLETLFDLQAASDRGEFISLLADRFPPKEKQKKGVLVDFLGSPAEFPPQVWMMAHTLACPVIYVSALRTGWRKYSLRAVQLTPRFEMNRKTRAQDLQNIVDLYVKELEEDCAQAPMQWFNFLDFWKISNEK
jgi:predicted LPLAT superfamily acyltransferase